MSWLAALATSPKLGRIQKISIAFLAPISWLAALATSPNVGRLQKFSIAFLAPISWLAALATSPNVGRLQKISIAFLAPISWLAALATSPNVGRLQKTLNRISRAYIVTSGTRNISKRWSTSKNFESHFSRQYRDQRHSQHLQTLVDFKKVSIAFLAPISWLAPLATSPNVGRLQKKR